MTSPCAGAEVGASCRFLRAIIFGTIEGSYWPLPTSTNSPTMLRTCLYKNPVPSISKRTPWSVSTTSNLVIVRTVSASGSRQAFGLMLAKAAKSCVPTKWTAASFILSTSTCETAHYERELKLERQPRKVYFSNTPIATIKTVKPLGGPKCSASATSMSNTFEAHAGWQNVLASCCAVRRLK